MIYDILTFALGCFIGGVGWHVLVVSTEIIEEKKARYRAGTHDYYGNRIDKDDV